MSDKISSWVNECIALIEQHAEARNGILTIPNSFISVPALSRLYQENSQEILESVKILIIDRISEITSGTDKNKEEKANNAASFLSNNLICRDYGHGKFWAIPKNMVSRLGLTPKEINDIKIVDLAKESNYDSKSVKRLLTEFIGIIGETSTEYFYQDLDGAWQITPKGKKYFLDNIAVEEKDVPREHVKLAKAANDLGLSHSHVANYCIKLSKELAQTGQPPKNFFYKARETIKEGKVLQVWIITPAGFNLIKSKTTFPEIGENDISTTEFATKHRYDKAFINHYWGQLFKELSEEHSQNKDIVSDFLYKSRKPEDKCPLLSYMTPAGEEMLLDKIKKARSSRPSRGTEFANTR